MEYMFLLFISVGGAIVKKLFLPFVFCVIVGIVVIGGIASLAGGSFLVAAKWVLVLALISAIIGPFVAAFIGLTRRRW